MKYFFYTLIAVTLYISCDSLTTTPPTTTPTEPTTITTNTGDEATATTLTNMKTAEAAIQAKIDALTDKFGDEQAMFDLDEAQQNLQEKHLQQLEDIMSKEGIISRSGYGNSNSDYALNLLSSADGARLEKHLPSLLNAVEKDEVTPRYVAVIHDKVLVHQGKKQLYGTQITFNEKKGMNDIYPIQDEANVDTRRAAVGLEPIATALLKKGIKYE